MEALQQARFANLACRLLTIQVANADVHPDRHNRVHEPMHGALQKLLLKLQDYHPELLENPCLHSLVPNLCRLSIEYSNTGFEDQRQLDVLAKVPSQIAHLELQYSFSAVTSSWLVKALREKQRMEQKIMFSAESVTTLSVSGAGKTTVMNALLACPNARWMIVFTLAPLPVSTRAGDFMGKMVLCDSWTIAIYHSVNKKLAVYEVLQLDLAPHELRLNAKPMDAIPRTGYIQQVPSGPSPEHLAFKGMGRRYSCPWIPLQPFTLATSTLVGPLQGTSRASFQEQYFKSIPPDFSFQSYYLKSILPSFLFQIILFFRIAAAFPCQLLTGCGRIFTPGGENCSRCDKGSHHHLHPIQPFLFLALTFNTKWEQALIQTAVQWHALVWDGLRRTKCQNFFAVIQTPPSYDKIFKISGSQLLLGLHILLNPQVFTQASPQAF
ncbi:hypothetical protein DFH07DRAFT_767941 [Mycena maculata]|uniref:Uncharacterized protein n=1 Tax=Mycena maculata TaxID=230809 RepID=A0AAD7NRX6_9AGAR|nr:hypothetical protein DFH07DRAFT_767941 [Mycena maculata]